MVVWLAHMVLMGAGGTASSTPTSTPSVPTTGAGQ